MSCSRVVVLANGEIKDLQYIRAQFRDDDYIICADGGAIHALSMGLKPSQVIGDMDSLPLWALEALKGGGTEIARFPAQKDKSDLELALDSAVALKPKEILLAGVLGGERFDQALGNLLLLTLPLRAGIPAQIIDDRHRICLMEKEIIVQGSPGTIISLFPLTPTVENISTQGLKYQLKGDALYFASTRGLSNEFTGSSARITIGSGLLLVIVCMGSV